MANKESLVVWKKPSLRKPRLVCGIGGWVDGGEAATGTLRYLRAKLGAKKFAEIDSQPYHLFQMPGETMLRPQVRLAEGLLREYELPMGEFFSWINPGASGDLVLFSGPEPNLNWQEYADTMLDLAQELGVVRIYAVGGVLDKSPHRKEPLITCSISDQALKSELAGFAVQYSNYEGPGSFSTMLLHKAGKRRLQFINMMARATYYPEFNIVIPHNPKAILALLRRLRRLLDIELDLTPLEKASQEMEGKLDLMMSQNRQFREYVEGLEKDFVELKYEESLEITGSEAVELAQELLKKGEDEGDDKDTH